MSPTEIKGSQYESPISEEFVIAPASVLCQSGVSVGIGDWVYDEESI